VRGQLDVITGMLSRQLPKIETMLCDAAPDLLACADFAVLHWKKIWSTNPLERVNKEIPNAAATSSASSPTPTSYSAFACSSKPTTNGKSATAATSPKDQWPYLQQRSPPSRRW
jgi:putative transposase